VIMQCTVFGIVFLSKYLFKATSSQNNNSNNNNNNDLFNENNNNNIGTIDDGGVIQTTDSLFSSSTVTAVFESLLDISGRDKRDLAEQLVNDTITILSNNAVRNKSNNDDAFLNSRRTILSVASAEDLINVNFILFYFDKFYIVYTKFFCFLIY
jgi:hypothetical protein